MCAFYGQTVWRKDAVESTSTSLGHFKAFVIGKFEDRAQWAEKEMDPIGLPQAAYAANQQL